MIYVPLRYLPISRFFSLVLALMVDRVHSQRRGSHDNYPLPGRTVRSTNERVCAFVHVRVTRLLSINHDDQPTRKDITSSGRDIRVTLVAHL